MTDKLRKSCRRGWGGVGLTGAAPHLHPVTLESQGSSSWRVRGGPRTAHDGHNEGGCVCAYDVIAWRARCTPSPGRVSCMRACAHAAYRPSHRFPFTQSPTRSLLESLSVSNHSKLEHPHKRHKDGGTRHTATCNHAPAWAGRLRRVGHARKNVHAQWSSADGSTAPAASSPAPHRGSPPHTRAAIR